MGMKEIYRHEEKFLIRYPQYVLLKQLLSPVMSPDVHAGEIGSYTVRSLYFDTLDNRDYYEKKNGDEVRRKIRLRTYFPAASFIRLEIKKKKQEGIRKESVLLEKEEAIRLYRDGDSSFLIEKTSAGAVELGRCFSTASYHPVILIEYEREAFTLPFYQIRITFDSRLCAGWNAEDFFAREACLYEVLPPDEIVLEVKYNHMLPSFLRRILGTVEGQSMAISKYYLAREILG